MVEASGVALWGRDTLCRDAAGAGQCGFHFKPLDVKPLDVDPLAVDPLAVESPSDEREWNVALDVRGDGPSAASRDFHIGWALFEGGNSSGW